MNEIGGESGKVDGDVSGGNGKMLIYIGDAIRRQID